MSFKFVVINLDLIIINMYIQTPRNTYKIEYISKKILTYDSLLTRLATWQLAQSIDILNLKTMNHHILNTIL